MPERQCDGGVIAVTHRATRVDARVPAHYPPTPSRSIGIATQEGAVFVRRNAVRISPTNVDHLTASAAELFHEMRFTSSTAKRFVAEDQFRIHHKRRLRHEEPFPLTTKR